MEYLSGEEILVSKSEKSYKELGWGPYQFPELYNINGVLYLEFHIEDDSALAYGKEKAKFISYDDGSTWSKTNLMGGYQINDNKIIRPKRYPSIDKDTINLPTPIHKVNIYNQERHIFNANEIERKYRDWTVLKGTPGNLKETNISVSHDNYCRYTSEGVLPMNFFLRFYKDPSNNIWALNQRFMVNNPNNNHALFYKSTDNGSSFNLNSIIYYNDKYNQLDKNITRVGFGEQSLTFVSETKAFSLLRTTDGHENSPLYISWSFDGAKTWNEPTFFDSIGVWPNVVSLNNGAFIAGYGRPGLYIRGLYNNIWDYKRTTIVEPTANQDDTCSYCSMVALSDDTFLIAYSKFQHTDSDGVNKKAIVVRKIKVEI